jgi:hypothetical protein
LKHETARRSKLRENYDNFVKDISGLMSKKIVWKRLEIHEDFNWMIEGKTAMTVKGISVRPEHK